MKKVKKYIVRVNDEYVGRLAYSQYDEPIVSQGNFKTHFEADIWLSDQIVKNELSYDVMSFQKLANIFIENPKNNKVKNILKMNIQILKEDMLFTLVVKEGVRESEAKKRVNKLCGGDWSTSLSKAKDNTLDALVSIGYEKTEKRLENLIKNFTDLNYQGTPDAQKVLDTINKIPGNKILTIHLEDVQTFDISEKGIVGYEKGHKSLLLKKIDIAFKKNNAFIIRQFIPDSKKEVVLANGEKVLIPWKALYGFIISDYKMIGISADDLEHASTHDANNNPIKVEDFVLYRDMSDFIVYT